MEVGVLAGGDALGLDPGLHAADLADGLGVEAAVPHVGLDHVEQAVAERTVAGDHPGPGHRLALPGERVLAPVDVEGVEAAGERAAAALGPEVGVDVVDAVGGGGAADEAHQRGGQALGLVGARGALGVVHEDHVEVAGVGELGAAEAPEADHRERDRRLERGERDLERGLGQRGQVVAHLVDLGVAEHVAGGDAEQVALLPAPQRALLLGRPSRSRDRGLGGGDQAVAVAGGQAATGRAGGPTRSGLWVRISPSRRLVPATRAQRLGGRRGVAEGLDQRAGWWARP